MTAAGTWQVSKALASAEASREQGSPSKLVSKLVDIRTEPRGRADFMWPVRILSLHVKTGIRLEAAVDSEKLADFVEEAGSKSINRAHFEAVHKERTMMNDECVCVRH